VVDRDNGITCKMEEIGVEERDCQLFFVPNCVSYIKCDRYSVQ